MHTRSIRRYASWAVAAAFTYASAPGWWLLVTAAPPLSRAYLAAEPLAGGLPGKSEIPNPAARGAAWSSSGPPACLMARFRLTPPGLASRPRAAAASRVGTSRIAERSSIRAMTCMTRWLAETPIWLEACSRQPA